MSVFGSVEYARIVEKHTGYSARLFVIEHEDSTIAYPFFLRPIENLPFSTDGQERYRDSISPEYTGPSLSGHPSPDLDALFADRWIIRCQQQRIIAEFAHLHPWDARLSCLEAGNVKFNREVVYVDLNWSQERLWGESYTYACRKNIKRAQQEGVRVVTAESEKDIEEFYRIYVQTMHHNQASDRYYFSLDYFLDFFRLLPQHARFVLASYQDKIVAGTLYLHDDIGIYSFLGGADRAFQQVRPTNSIVHEVIQWGQRIGKRRLILGAGYEPSDGIFRFKASFSPLRARFFIYERIHLYDIYSRLCQQWQTHYGQTIRTHGYFPAYRDMPHTENNSAES